MRWSAHISWLFAELPYAERVGAAHRAGFDAIESAWPAESGGDGDALARAVAEHGVDVVLLNVAAGDVAGGERGFVNDSSRREESEAAFAAAVELACRVGAPSVNVLVGRALPGVPEARQRAAVVAALRAFAPVAAGGGLRVLLEPVNAIENPGFLAPTPDAAVALIEDAGADELGLLLDVYHVAHAADDPLEAIARHGERIGHVQVSDWPGRGAPGSGSLDFHAILDALAVSGYDGAVGLEYESGGRTEVTLDALRDLVLAAPVPEREDV